MLTDDLAAARGQEAGLRAAEPCRTGGRRGRASGAGRGGLRRVGLEDGADGRGAQELSRLTGTEADSRLSGVIVRGAAAAGPLGAKPVAPRRTCACRQHHLRSPEAGTAPSPWRDEWINTGWSGPTTGGINYSAIMLSEERPDAQGHTCTILRNVRKGQIHRDGKQISGAGERGEELLGGHRAASWGDKKCVIFRGDVCTALWLH